MRRQIASSRRPINFWGLAPDRALFAYKNWINELNAPAIEHTRAYLRATISTQPNSVCASDFILELINLLASGMNRATQINKNSRIIFYQLPFKRALSRLIIFREFTSFIENELWVYSCNCLRRYTYRMEKRKFILSAALVISGVQSTRPQHYALINYSSAKVLDTHPTQTWSTT